MPSAARNVTAPAIVVGLNEAPPCFFACRWHVAAVSRAKPRRPAASVEPRYGQRGAATWAARLLAVLPLGPLSLPAFASGLPPGFVSLRDVDPTIRQDMRYAGPFN